jgi:membrane protein implicated in regulation of membrane protease activity
MEFWQSFWLILGVVLILAEFILPGGIAFFVGAGALFVAGSYFLGWIQDPLTGFSIWFMISLTFLFALKGFVDQFLPNRTSVSNTDEDLDAFGAKVEVVSPVSDQQEGRIHFQGTSWPALSRREGVSFREGDEAVIIFRKNMTWLIDREVEQPESNPNQEDN